MNPRQPPLCFYYVLVVVGQEEVHGSESSRNHGCSGVQVAQRYHGFPFPDAVHDRDCVLVRRVRGRERGFKEGYQICVELVVGGDCVAAAFDEAGLGNGEVSGVQPILSRIEEKDGYFGVPVAVKAPVVSCEGCPHLCCFRKVTMPDIKLSQGRAGRNKRFSIRGVDKGIERFN